ncbi:hypothetical protein SAMN05421823_11832 [Catalinimonas alkaloidigena]|uniref:Uncharacterized protein n=1 Tax=Catalinimonas alkaloidigena TaxID=1075417 RepID=A0A1G9UYA2_9BACT|nr:hypothetical protein [Catalinimonas alkaloidigena]SDM64843.1 hypothetical protein SAMN05421823_11832 [Catalinimonas alkaloidigena]
MRKTSSLIIGGCLLLAGACASPQERATTQLADSLYRAFCRSAGDTSVYEPLSTAVVDTLTVGENARRQLAQLPAGLGHRRQHYVGQQRDPRVLLVHYQHVARHRLASGETVKSTFYVDIDTLGRVVYMTLDPSRVVESLP